MRAAAGVGSLLPRRREGVLYVSRLEHRALAQIFVDSYELRMRYDSVLPAQTQPLLAFCWLASVSQPLASYFSASLPSDFLGLQCPVQQQQVPDTHTRSRWSL